MDAHQSSSERRRWLLRSMALTVALGAALLGFSAQRPGYLGFALISTLGFFLAGLLWTGGNSSGGSRRPVSAPPRLSSTTAGLPPTVLIRARTYRVGRARSAGPAAA
jgi:hypothetical protein